MQTKIYDKIDEYANRDRNPFENLITGDATVGHIRAHEGQIHCGNNQYISIKRYENAKNRAAGRKNEYSIFVKEMSETIIGIEQLRNSSVTGRKCNRTQSAPRPKLEEHLLGAVYGIFKYYLTKEKKYNPVEVNMEVTHVGAYIALKIWDLNRAKRKQGKKEDNEKSKRSEEALYGAPESNVAPANGSDASETSSSDDDEDDEDSSDDSNDSTENPKKDNNKSSGNESDA